MPKERQVAGVTINADRIAGALLDRLFVVEKQLASIRRELNSHMEMIAEAVPRVTKDGQVQLRAISADLDSCASFVVTVQATSVVPEAKD